MKNKSDLSTSVVVFLILDVIFGVAFFVLNQSITWSTMIAFVLALIFWYFPQIGRLVGLNHPKPAKAAPVATPYADYYQINCQLDRQTCPDCGARDGRIYRTDEARPGRNYPPFHDGCRCIASPCTGDLPETNDRQYRDPQTGVLKTGPYLTYTDWHKAMVKKYGKSVFK
ncbi:minor capsid protein [Levilactobacillus tujiorum]|uniref:Minor capsid protein n=1 Tax=Levilactobacillus tujiorum TaxID=2912243 RepID=A0ABX1L4Y2_9LACO|nr:minor capsid protein [Levilactobacillus tujiorum]NLR11540.1 minor capsid protein [Lactobacillus sp. HBUAS51387]NLR28942.1 minor capsid protein [Levilactobacillus tujiorum]